MILIVLNNNLSRMERELPRAHLAKEKAKVKVKAKGKVRVVANRQGTDPHARFADYHTEIPITLRKEVIVK